MRASTAQVQERMKEAPRPMIIHGRVVGGDYLHQVPAGTEVGQARRHCSADQDQCGGLGGGSGATYPWLLPAPASISRTYSSLDVPIDSCLVIADVRRLWRWQCAALRQPCRCPVIRIIPPIGGRDLTADWHAFCSGVVEPVKAASCPQCRTRLKQVLERDSQLPHCQLETID